MDCARTGWRAIERRDRFEWRLADESDGIVTARPRARAGMEHTLNVNAIWRPIIDLHQTDLDHASDELSALARERRLLMADSQQSHWHDRPEYPPEAASLVNIISL